MAHVRLQYHCSIFAAHLQSVLHVQWTDPQCIRDTMPRTYQIRNLLPPFKEYASSEVQYFKRSTMYFVLKYPLKCSEVCFEVQRSTQYFAALGLHCRRTWVLIAAPFIVRNILNDSFSIFNLEKDMFYTLSNVKHNNRDSLLQKPKHF